MHEEDLEASSASQPAPSQEKRKRKKSAAVDGDRQYSWRDEHQNTLAEFWLNHPIFYDKAQQHYKNKDIKMQLIQEFIQQNREDWEKIHSPLPTSEQKFCFLIAEFYFEIKSGKNQICKQVIPL